MTILFTPEDLLQYLYNETSAEQSQAIEQALQQDWALREKFDVLRSGAKILDRKLESPRPASIVNILEYARKTQEVSIDQ